MKFISVWKKPFKDKTQETKHDMTQKLALSVWVTPAW